VFTAAIHLSRSAGQLLCARANQRKIRQVNLSADAREPQVIAKRLMNNLGCLSFIAGQLSVAYDWHMASEKENANVCPSCGAVMASGAVLCIACGYHLQLQRFLATSSEREQRHAPSDNPCAPPASDESDEQPRDRPGLAFDLTEPAARRAEAVASAASSVAIVIAFVLCVCGPAWAFMLPWYGYRLLCWYRLNGEFAELRHPNSLSPHGELAVRFQDAWIRLVCAIAFGSVFWLIVAIGFAMGLLESAHLLPGTK
jgi:uncharacterized Zn finger protein (UPF0148 family)